MVYPGYNWNVFGRSETRVERRLEGRESILDPQRKF